MKIYLLFAMCFIGELALMADENVLPCQMLLSEKEIEQQGFNRQRRMYPQSSAQRLSQAAAQAGFAAKDTATAMTEFNRAWRFNPKNPLAYWGAAIVRGREAESLTDEKLRGLCWYDSVSLFEKALPLMDGVPERIRENFDLDYATSLIGLGAFVKKTDTKESDTCFRRAEKLLLPLAKRPLEATDRSKMVRSRVSALLSNLYQAEGNQIKANEYLQKKDKP